MSPESRFQHHGEPVETREQWAARQAAEAAARARAQEEAMRRAAKSAQAQAPQGEARRHIAPPRASPPEREPSLLSRKTTSWPAAVVLVVACGVAVFVATGRSPAVAEQPPSPASDREAAPITSEAPSAPAREEPVRPERTDSMLRSPYGMSTAKPAEAPQRLDMLQIPAPQSAWADSPSISPQSDGWWCICYQTLTGNARTACRRLPDECETLREMIQTKGSSLILAGSATPGSCRYVPGAYPWLRLGHRESWSPSSYYGATQARDVCAL